MIIDTLWYRVLPLCFILFGLLAGTGATAQKHFDGCAHRTESNATVILPDSLDLRIDGHQPEGPLEVAVYNEENECAGSTEWNGEAATLTAWGSTPSSVPEEKTLHPGDSMHVRLFDATCGVEYNRSNSSVALTLRDDGPPTADEAQYAPDAIYILDEIVLHSQFLSASGSCPRLLVPQDAPFIPHPKADSGIAQSRTAAKQN